MWLWLSRIRQVCMWLSQSRGRRLCLLCSRAVGPLQRRSSGCSAYCYKPCEAVGVPHCGRPGPAEPAQERSCARAPSTKLQRCWCLRGARCPPVCVCVCRQQCARHPAHPGCPAPPTAYTCARDGPEPHRNVVQPPVFCAVAGPSTRAHITLVGLPVGACAHDDPVLGPCTDCRHIWGCVDRPPRGHWRDCAGPGCHKCFCALSLQVCCVVHDPVPLARRPQALCVGPSQDWQPGTLCSLGLIHVCHRFWPLLPWRAC